MSEPGTGYQTAAERDGDLVDLRAAVRMIRTRFWIILGTVTFVMTATVLWLLQTTPLYRAQALILIEPRENRVMDGQAVLAQLTTDQTTIANQVELIRSRSLAERVIGQLGLDRDPVFVQRAERTSLLSRINPLSALSPEVTARESAGGQDRTDRYVDAFLDHLSAVVRAQSTVIDLRYTSPSPGNAARIVNALAEAYVQDQLEAKYEATRRATDWLAARLQSLSEQVEQTERAAAQYRLEHALTEAETGSTLVDQQLIDLNTQVSLARAEEAEAEAKYAQANVLYDRGEAVDTISQVLSSGLISQLRQQETVLLRREAELSNRYGARHPSMVQLRAERRNLADKIDAEVRRIILQLRNERDVARARVDSLESRVALIESTVAGQNQARIKLRELERAADSSRRLHEAYLARFKETEGQSGIEAPDARVISTAPVPREASYPPTVLVLGAMLPGALILGLVLALAAERLDNGYRRTHRLEADLDLPVLAVLEDVPRAALRAAGSLAGHVAEQALSSQAEALRGFQAGLALRNVDAPPKVVLVTSSIAGEGKTGFATALARLGADQGEKTLLVDADLRRPAAADALGLTERGPGLVGYLGDRTPLDAVLLRDPASPLDLLPGTAASAHAPALLRSERLAGLIAQLRERYDRIIIDSAPVLPVHDTKHLIRLVDAVAFIVRWERTPRDAVKAAVKDLRLLDAPLAGVVLTRVHPRRHALYSYGAYDRAAYAPYADS